MSLETILNDISPSWGVCDFSPLKEELLDRRVKVSSIDGYQSIIVALFPYYLGEDAYAGLNISRYAVVPDYHGVVMERLEKAAGLLKDGFPDGRFTPFTDNSPIPEVRAAVLAGLGYRGKHGLLIHPRYGSWVFIGEILSTVRFEPSVPRSTGGCGNCRLCVDACPANILGANRPDKTGCVSNISQRKGVLTPEQEDLLRNAGSAWGCDICQSACPANANAKTSPIEEFRHPVKARVDKDTEIKGRAFAWRGKEVIRRNLDILENGDSL